jgi:hypothetical protein
LGDISVSLINTGKLAIGPHLKALSALIGVLSVEWKPDVDREKYIPVYR